MEGRASRKLPLMAEFDMRPSAALEIALALAEQPDSFRGAGYGPLPSGVTLLLEVAAGELAALNAARTMTTRPQAALEQAATVFIERVLFAEAADSYRILGACRTTTRKELRRHMALLVKWLHHDEPDRSPADPRTDKVSFFPRVTQAWEHLKTDSRRAAYDQILTRGSDDITRWNPALTAALAPSKSALQLIVYKPGARRASRRLVIYRIPSDTLFSRLLYYLGRHA
jgi:hypothetical protein